MSECGLFRGTDRTPWAGVFANPEEYRKVEYPRRSALYLPASNPRAVEKARSLDCDVVILDLEDSIGPESKVVAREAAARAIRDGGFGGREVVVRVNGLDTAWGEEDLAAVSTVRPSGVLVPKIDGVESLRKYADAAAGVSLWAMIETCGAILALRELAEASASCGCVAWIMGLNDLAKEMRVRGTGGRSVLFPSLTLSVTAARSKGLGILDGVHNDLEDMESFRRECEEGSSLGFDGKTVIHPSQIAIANRAFGPTPEELEWAQTVAEYYARPENGNAGVVRIQGRMVERLHLAEAVRTLDIDSAVRARDELRNPTD
jgi:citrate lyase subunit beta/citryl-CoA lyase